mmetsp:Transcript_5159/g.7638  ORF Transcript_5159/g.7638 Transcript_5159/m.7638 type:complete len:170 (+) Transcript_5159:75-584(+)
MIKENVIKQYEYSIANQKTYESDYLIYLQQVRSKENYVDPFSMGSILENSQGDREEKMVVYETMIKTKLNKYVDQQVAKDMVRTKVVKKERDESHQLQINKWLEEQHLHLTKIHQSIPETTTHNVFELFLKHDYDNEATENIYMQFHTFLNALKTLTSYQDLFDKFKYT